MATHSLAALTPEELALAEKFPTTKRPFAVWRYIDPDNADKRAWAVNGVRESESTSFEDINLAFKAAQNLASEWAAKVKEWTDQTRVCRVLCKRNSLMLRHPVVELDCKLV